MAIDKIKLRHLAKDKDERSFQEGDMLDALNVGVLPEGETSGDVIKNSKSTVSGTALTTTDQIPTEESRVVGSVSDPARGFVYFFVWSTTATNHAIYQYDSKTDKYRIVLKNSLLAFSKFGFVKADVVNGEFQRDETTQTIVYFTDGVNPPRKINVDRVLLDGVDDYSALEITELLSVIKTPSLFEPKITLSTDTTRTTNNLYGRVLQFAIQFEYKDGEVSALSPHSKLVYPRYMSIQGLTQTAVTLADLNSDNLALVDTKWMSYPYSLSGHQAEVSKIKLLAREYNSSSFFVVDKFNPTEDLVRNGITVYNALNGVYSFYNDGLYIFEEPSITDKVYDDVPRKAVGQSVAGNRLMYSNSLSGYANTPITATLTPSYGVVPSNSIAGAGTDAATTVTYPYPWGDGRVAIDYSSFPDTVLAGTVVSVTFEYKPTTSTMWGYSTSNTDDVPMFHLNFGPDPYTNAVTLKGGLADSSDTIDLDGAFTLNIGLSSPGGGDRPTHLSWATLTATVVIAEDMTDHAAAQLLADEIHQQTLSYTYFDQGDVIQMPLKNSTDAIVGTLETSKINFDVGFSLNQDTANTLLILSPRCGNFSIPTGLMATNATGAIMSGFVRVVNSGVGASNIYFNGLESILPTGQMANAGGYYFVNGIPFQSTGDTMDDNWGSYSPTNSNVGKRNGVREDTISSHPLNSLRTFKAGCDHGFGIVYFDEHGRPGRVNEIGSTHVLPFGDSGRTIATVVYNGNCNISLDITSDPPPWAKTYQIVYTDMLTWESFESYTVGGAWYEVNDGGTDNDAIYVSLNTLLKYQSDKGAIKDYKWTPGDKLRVISFEPDGAAPGTLTYPNPDTYTFDVVGYETFVTDLDAVTDVAAHTNHRGKFLKLAIPGGDTANIPNFVPGGTPNYWRNQCLVEILTPKKLASENIPHYEFGESRKIFLLDELTVSTNNRHNDGDPIVLSEGSIHYKPTACAVPQWLSATTEPPITGNSYWGTSAVEHFSFVSRMTESMDVSDMVASRAWNKGRAHVKYDKAASVNYFNRIVYSEESGDDIGGIKYSSFNPGALSYKNLNKAYGKVNWIGSNGEKLHVLQENKLSAMGVKRNIVEYSDGAANQTISGDVLGNVSYASGDYGCGSDQSAVLLQDGTLYFVDRSRQKVLKLTQDQLTPISDIDMSSYFESEFDGLAAADGDGGRIISGFDPQERMYYVTFEPKGGTAAYAGSTVGYSPDKSNGKWISRYSFLPSNYANIDNVFLSGKYYASGNLLNNHSDTATRNTFYGTRYDSEVEVISKMYPSEVKVFNALSYEGSSNDWTVSTSEITTNLGQTSASAVAFEEREGAFYKEMPRDGSANSTSHYLYLGKVVEIDDINVIMDSRLDRIPIPNTGTVLYFVYSDNYTVTDTQFNGFSGSTLYTASNPLTGFAVGEPLYLYLSKIDNGDPLRGHWAKIKLTSIVTSPSELYCINTHVSGSNLHHLKGSE